VIDDEPVGTVTGPECGPPGGTDFSELMRSTNVLANRLLLPGHLLG
jgi:hypothetical protein